jgi:hypothetical protein
MLLKLPANSKYLWMLEWAALLWPEKNGRILYGQSVIEPMAIADVVESF